MAEVVLDANVLVGLLDSSDVLAPHAVALLQRLQESGSDPVLLDVCVSEAVSVICRRSQQRKNNPPDLGNALAMIRAAAERGEIRYVAKESERFLPDVLAIVELTAGAVNFNDALLIALQRANVIEDVASFDQGLDAASGFRRLS